MAIEAYRISLLELEDCRLQIEPRRLIEILKVWRKGKGIHARKCSVCRRRLDYHGSKSFDVCCDRFYFRPHASPVVPVAVPTPGYPFLADQLRRLIEQRRIPSRQEFLVLPDPIFWSMRSTLVYEKVARYVLGEPMTRRTRNVQPASKAPLFYRQVQEAPLNYGSLESRSCGKATLMRQVAFGKRVRYSMRGMIVPDPTLRPNQIRVPDRIADRFSLRGKWVLLNRMPSLQPENFVGLRVPPSGDGPS